MIASFVSKTGYVATVVVDSRRTVNADWCTNICLPDVITELWKNKTSHHIVLHHENANSYTARQTTEYLRQRKIELLDHPAYSPGLFNCGNEIHCYYNFMTTLKWLSVALSRSSSPTTSKFLVQNGWSMNEKSKINQINITPSFPRDIVLHKSQTKLFGYDTSL